MASLVIRGPVKVLIILFSAAVLGVSLWGNVLLRQEFNPVWFLPAESYLAQWHHHNSVSSFQLSWPSWTWCTSS